MLATLGEEPRVDRNRGRHVVSRRIDSAMSLGIADEWTSTYFGN